METMPRWVPKAIMYFWGVFAALLVFYWMFNELRGFVLILLVSLFLSFALEPAVNYLSRRGWRRGAATGFVFLVLFFFCAIVITAVGSVVVNQVQDFVEKAPDYVDRTERWVNETFDANIDADEVRDRLTADDGPVTEIVNRLARNAVSIGTSAIGIVFQAFTILLFTFYLVADGPKLRRTICSYLPPDKQRHVLRNWDLAIEKTGGYIYSRGLLAVISAIAHWAAFQVIGVPYPLALGIWVGLISQFIPVIGTYIAGALPVFVALLSDPVDALWALGFVVVYQQVENYFLAPRVTAHTMNMHPAVAFGAVIVGASMFGPAGALLALPAAALAQAFAGEYLQQHELIDTKLMSERHPKDRK